MRISRREELTVCRENRQAKLRWINPRECRDVVSDSSAISPLGNLETDLIQHRLKA